MLSAERAVIPAWDRRDVKESLFALEGNKYSS